MLLWDLFLRLDGLAGDGAVDLMEQGVQLVPADGFQLLELLALGLLAPVMQDDARDDQDRAQDHAEEQHAGEVAEELIAVNTTKPPIIITSPWAKFSIFAIPYTMVYPSAISA